MGEEVGQDLPAARGVRDLGMKLQPVDCQSAMLDRGNGAGCCLGKRDEVIRDSGDLIAVLIQTSRSCGKLANSDSSLMTWQ